MAISDGLEDGCAERWSECVGRDGLYSITSGTSAERLRPPAMFALLYRLSALGPDHRRDFEEQAKLTSTGMQEMECPGMERLGCKTTPSPSPKEQKQWQGRQWRVKTRL